MNAVDLVIPGSIDQVSGGYIYDRRIFDELRSLGWQTAVRSLDPSFPDPTRAALSGARKTLERIADGRLVVIDGLALAGLGPLLGAERMRLKLVALIHHPLALEPDLAPDARRRLGESERRALEQVEHVIVTSRWTRAALADYGVRSDRVQVVEPGVDRPARRVSTPAGATLRMLTVGNVTARKGHLLLIDALAPLADRDWTLRCVGSLHTDPTTALALRSRISQLGFDDRITLLGQIAPDRVTSEYAAADLFVLASQLEGYGMVVAEAVAHGLPVVAFGAGAIPDTLPAAAGILVPPGDPMRLGSTIAALLDDRAQLAELGTGARAAAADLPTWHTSARRFAATLERLVA